MNFQNKIFQVCLSAFTLIHGISRQQIRTVQPKDDVRDRRGTHMNRPAKVRKEAKQKVGSVTFSCPIIPNMN